MTSIFNTWLERIEAEHIQHHQVIQLYAAVYPLAQGYRPRGKRTNLRKAEAQAIMARIYERARNGNGLRATADNEERGRDWLHANRRKLGLPDSFDARSIIEFRLVGFHVYTRDDRWKTLAASPIWRALLPDGSTFDYAPTAWQATARKDAPAMWWKLNPPRRAA